MFQRYCRLLLFSLCLGLSACATAPTDPLARAEYERINDPLEPLNRGVYAFNTVFQSMIMRPLSAMYNLLPGSVRLTVTNFMRNLSEPRNAINALLQGKPKDAGHSLGRFMTNSTLGIGGLLEITGSKYYAPKDFGGTLSLWSGRQSAYLELPFIGPSSFTDAVGSVVDGLYFVPRLQANHTGSSRTVPAVSAINALQFYAGNAQNIKNLRKTTPDPYIAFRSAYRQQRQRQLFGANYDLDSLEID